MLLWSNDGSEYVHHTDSKKIPVNQILGWVHTWSFAFNDGNPWSCLHRAKNSVSFLPTKVNRKSITKHLKINLVKHWISLISLLQEDQKKLSKVEEKCFNKFSSIICSPQYITIWLPPIPLQENSNF